MRVLEWKDWMCEWTKGWFDFSGLSNLVEHLVIVAHILRYYSSLFIISSCLFFGLSDNWVGRIKVAVLVLEWETGT